MNIEKEADWTTKSGLRAIVHKISTDRGYRCGYVEVPPALNNVHYDDIKFDIDVHGGITFVGTPHEQQGWWIGFDCAHMHDFDRDYKPLRSLEYVKDQCEYLAEQLIALNAKDQENK